MDAREKVLVGLGGEVKTPPLSSEARVEAGVLLRRLQRGERLSMPHSRPRPIIGPRCHELRVQDEKAAWRLVYFIEGDAVAILDVFEKKTSKTPERVVETCRRRLKAYKALG
jgi:phage-related protein